MTLEKDYSLFVEEQFEALFKERALESVAFELQSFLNSEKAVMLSSTLLKPLAILEYLETHAVSDIKVSAISSGQDFHIDTLQSFNTVGLRSIIGLQELYADKKSLANEHCRLGHIKEDVFVAEPHLREVDLLLIDLGSLKFNECRAKLNYSPIGLTSEELCNLIYFASNGKTNKVILYGYKEDCEDGDLHSLAEMVRHLMHYLNKGSQNRTSANLEISQYLKKYIVNIEELEEPVEFVMNELSNKWWINKGEDYLPCSQREYQQATKGHLSDHLLDILSE